MPITKPNSLKRLTGSRHYNPDEPVAPPLADLRPPRGLLSPRARRFWNEHAPTLASMNILTAADAAAFALLCEFWALTWAAVDELHSDGLTLPGEKAAAKKAPAAQLARDFATATVKLLGEFGMLPAARGRMSVNVGSDPDETDAFFAELKWLANGEVGDD